MKSAIIAAAVALLISATSATGAFIVTSKNIKNGTIPDGRHQRQSQAGAEGESRTARLSGAARGTRAAGADRSGWTRRANRGPRRPPRPTLPSRLTERSTRGTQRASPARTCRIPRPASIACATRGSGPRLQSVVAVHQSALRR
jgi:hypothetical protein